MISEETVDMNMKNDAPQEEQRSILEGIANGKFFQKESELVIDEEVYPFLSLEQNMSYESYQLLKANEISGSVEYTACLIDNERGKKAIIKSSSDPMPNMIIEDI